MYGDVSPSHRERFERGAFALDGRTRWLDVRHNRETVIAWTGGGGLELTDTREALMVRAALPEIPAADRALEDVRTGRLKGFSVEFRATDERRESGIRVVRRAELSGVGLVAAPSYEQSAVEVRARSGRTLRASIPSGKNLACRCSGIQCKFARFQKETLQKMLDETWGEFEKWAATQAGRRPPEVVAGFGSFDMPLASISSGTLRGRMRGDDLEVDIDVPEGAAGAAATAAHDAAGVIVRPYIDADAAESVMEGETRVYTRAPLRGVLVSATDQREGWPRVQVIPTPNLDDTASRASPRRRRAWL